MTNSRILESGQLERLLAAGHRLVAELELEVVLDQLLDAARDLTGARYAALGVLDSEKRGLEHFAFAGIDEETRRRIGPLPRGHGILGELIRDPRPLRLEQISSHPRSYGFPAEHPPMETFLGVPVMIRGEVYGNLYLTEKEGGEPFTAADQELATVLAEWAAIAIANARSHEAVGERRAELERAVRGLQATVDLDREIGMETSLERVLELVAKRSRALVEASTIVILMLDHGRLVVAEAAGEVTEDIRDRSVDPSSPAHDVLRAGVGQRIGATTVSRFAELGIEASEGILVPLRHRGADLGVVAAFARSDASPRFGRDEELLLSSFAVGAAAAIGGSRAAETAKLRLSMRASENERRRWARELHDETLQELSALRVMQESALQTESPQAMHHALVRASEQIRETIAGLEGLITELRPAALDQLGVKAALEALVDRLRARNPLALHLDVDLAFERGEEPERHAPELEASVYRIVQEALTNVVKHADALNAWVAVEERAGVFSITIEDDGKGIDPNTPTEGFGLVGMRERVEIAQGELSIGPREGGGTRVHVRLPVIRRRASEATTD